MKTGLTFLASAVASANAGCKHFESEIDFISQHFAEHMKSACGVDATIESCVDGQVDGSSALVFDFIMKDSRGVEFLAKATKSTFSSRELSVEYKTDLCDSKMMLTGTPLSLPVQESGVVAPAEYIAEKLREQEEANFLQASPENIIADRMNLVRLYLLANDASFGTLPAELDITFEDDEEPTQEYLAALQAHQQKQYETLIAAVLDTEFEYFRDSEGVAARRRVGDVVLTGLEEPSTSAEEGFSPSFLSASFTSELTSGSGNMGNLRRYFEAIADGRAPRRWNDKTIVAQVNSLLPRNFDPRTVRRDASLPDTRGCFTEESVLQQGQCGSCWAFTAIAEIQHQACVRRGGPIKSVNGGLMTPSAQALLDCSKARGSSNPCKGNMMESSLDKITSDPEYPYQMRCNALSNFNDPYFEKAGPPSQRKQFCQAARAAVSSDAWPCECVPNPAIDRQQCRKDNFKARYTTDGMDAEKKNMKRDKDFIIPYTKGMVYFNGAVRVMMRAHAGFQKYYLDGKNTGSIYVSRDSPREWSGEHNYHAVTLVGWGYDERLRKEYWVIQNSWGVEFNDAGFFYVYMDDPVMHEGVYTSHEIIYSIKARYANNAELAVPRLDRLPTTAKIGTQVFWTPGLATASYTFALLCDTPNCGVYPVQKNNMWGSFYAKMFARAEHYKYPAQQYVNIPVEALSGDKKFVDVTMFSHHYKLKKIRVRLPHRLYDPQIYKLMYRVGMDTYFKKGTPYSGVLDFAVVCPNQKLTREVRNLKTVCNAFYEM